MSNGVRIALDAMGGDFGPSVVVPGAAIARDRRPDTSYLFFGDEKQIKPLLEQHPKLAAVSEIRHTTVVVKSDDKPSQAVRAGRRGSSMWLARMRATIGADAEHLMDLAIMGSAMARIFFDIERPTVGLLNVGTEDIKGLEEVKAASRRLREANIPTMDYRGFVEGDDLGKGTVDVVVTEGFTGNIALKTAEGTAKQIAQYMRDAFRSSLMSKLGALMARGAFQALKEKIDPRRVNGGLFLGLDGVIIKSHGGMDSVGFDMARHKLLDKIRETILLSSEAEAAAAAAPPPEEETNRG